MRKGYVLVPGAGMSDWVWNKIIPLLKYESFSIPRRLKINNIENRLTATFTDVLNYANEIIDETGFDEVVLVCHSGAGLIGGTLGKLNPKIKHIVFIAANIPRSGETAISVFPEEIQNKNIEAIKAQASSDYIPMKKLEQQFRNYFCNTCTEEDVSYILEQEFIPEPICVITEKVDWTDFPEKGMTYIACTQDKTLTIENQEFLASNLNIKEIKRISSDHLVMISHPTELATVLNEL